MPGTAGTAGAAGIPFTAGTPFTATPARAPAVLADALRTMGMDAIHTDQVAAEFHEPLIRLAAA